MNLAPIVLQLRSVETRFNNNIGGAADLSVILNQPADIVFPEGVYVVQLGESASIHDNDNHINQVIAETFAVVIVLQNDSTQKDKTGLTAHDSLSAIRSQIFKGILGYEIDGAESLIYYVGGRLVRMTRANFFYQFEFGVDTRITMEDAITNEATDMLNTIFTQYIQAGSEFNNELPVPGGRIPVPTEDTDMEQEIDLT